MIDLQAAKPILFNTEMVQKILEGRKTQTRRLVVFTKPYRLRSYSGLNAAGKHVFDWSYITHSTHFDGWEELKAPYSVGDTLWVRETFANYHCVECEGDEHGDCFADEYQKGDGHCWIYKADGVTLTGDGKWSPAVHMPREAARIFLRVTDVRAERVQDITDDDAIAEGVGSKTMGQGFGKYYYSSVWDRTYAKRGYGWDKNPWCWKICFERIKEGK